MLLELFLFGLEILIGYIYPFFACFSLISKKNIGTLNHEEGQKWCVYWISIATLSKTLFPILDWFAKYYLAVTLLLKVIIMGYLALPYLNGSMFIYKNFILSREQRDIWTEYFRINVKTYFEKIKTVVKTKMKVE